MSQPASFARKNQMDKRDRVVSRFFCPEPSLPELINFETTSLCSIDGRRHPQTGEEEVLLVWLVSLVGLVENPKSHLLDQLNRSNVYALPCPRASAWVCG
jgi:hypothetical protein